MIVSHVGDVAPGICVCVPYPPGPYPATGVVTTGAPLFNTGGMPVATMGGSIIMFPCGTSIIAMGNPLFTTSGLPIGRLGDPVIGCGIGTLLGTSTIISL